MTSISRATTLADPGRFDLLLRGGTVIDPAQGIHGRRDVGIRAGLSRPSKKGCRKPAPIRSSTPPGCS